MAEYTLDMEVRTNADWADALAFVAGDPAAPVNLTGYAFEQHIRTAPDASYTVLTCSTANGRLVIGTPASAGNLAWNVPVAVMRSLRPGVYVHDIALTVGGKTRVFAKGEITVVEGVTK